MSETKRTDELARGDAVRDKSTQSPMIRRVTHTQPFDKAMTLVVLDDGSTGKWRNDSEWTIATEDEIEAAYDRQQRADTADGLIAFAHAVRQSGLPIPSYGLHIDYRVKTVDELRAAGRAFGVEVSPLSYGDSDVVEWRFEGHPDRGPVLFLRVLGPREPEPEVADDDAALADEAGAGIRVPPVRTSLDDDGIEGTPLGTRGGAS